MAKASHSLSGYFAVYGALMLLLLITWGVAYLDLGAWNIAIGLAIGALKTLLIMIVFMHLKSSRATTVLSALLGFFWLGILLVLVFTDYISRPWLDVPGK